LPTIVAKISADLELQAVTTTVQVGVGDPQITLARSAIELALGELLENAKFHPQHAPTVSGRVPLECHDGQPSGWR
jgi:hypothetical protein